MELSGKKSKRNIAYIDGANLDKALKQSLIWQLDYARFRVWLTDKYQIETAYIFIGLIPKYAPLYTYLQACGFTLIFKEVVYQKGVPKGNCDTDLAVKVLEDLYEHNLNKAVLVTSDGDYASLIKSLNNKGALSVVLSPATPNKLSILIKKTGVKIAYLTDQRNILELNKNEKAPTKDKP